METDALFIRAASPSTGEQGDWIVCTFDLFAITSVIDILIASFNKTIMFIAFRSHSLSPCPIPQEKEVLQKKTLVSRTPGLTCSQDTSSVSQPKPSSMPATQFQQSYWCIFGLSPFSIVISCFSLPSFKVQFRKPE